MFKTPLWQQGLAGAVLMAGAGFGLPGYAQAIGDGSGTNNPGLLRGGYDQGCGVDWICPVTSQPAPMPVETAPSPPVLPAPEPEMAVPLPPPVVPETVLDPEAYALVNADPPPPASKFEADWSLALRGSYEATTDGPRFGISINPSVSVSRGDTRSEVVFGADASIIKEGGDEYRLSSASGDVNGRYALSQTAEVSASASVSASQSSPYSFDAPSGIAQQPLVLSGQGSATLSQRFGHLGTEIEGRLARTVYGDTIPTVGPPESNADQSSWSFGATARLLYELSGRISLYTLGSVDRDLPDAPSSSLGVNLASITYAVGVGMRGNWNDVFSFDTSVGYGLRRYDDASLTDDPLWLINAGASYRPNEALEISADAGTELSKADSSLSTTAQIDYTAGLSVLYRLNDRWTLRGDIGGRWTRYPALMTQWEDDYQLGFGVDWQVNKHTLLSAGYTYQQQLETGELPDESHRIDLGVTFSR